jgi:predicted nucleic acid-binding protein
VTKPYQIVLDTNVLVSAFRPQRGASYKLLTVLKERPGMIEGFSDSAIDAFLDGLCAIANRHDIFYLWRPLARDPDDDLLLDLAVRAPGSIITYNARDLLPAAEFGIALVTAKSFCSGWENYHDQDRITDSRFALQAGQIARRT